MADIRSIRLRQLQGKLGEVAYELTRVHFSQRFSSPKWQPLINAYRCKDGMIVCAELAGVKKEDLNISVEPGRLLLKGRRAAPEPAEMKMEILQVLAMEIDYGPFERQLKLPLEVDPEHVTAEQREGFLWIYLPFRAHA